MPIHSAALCSRYTVLCAGFSIISLVGHVGVLRHEDPLAVALSQQLIELEGKSLQLGISLRHILHGRPGFFSGIGAPAANSCNLLANIPFTGQLLSLFYFPTSLLVLLRITAQINHLLARFSKDCIFLNSKTAFYK